ncbi:MAG TPA: hypothetical protein VIU33_07070 [Nitrospiria bacterium]
MCFFISIFPATAWFIIGYFILFSSTKAEGGVQTFGRLLAVWVLILASLIPVMGAYLTLSGLCPIETMIETMHSGKAF